MDFIPYLTGGRRGRVRQSIIRKIDWTGASFCVVGDAESGREEALENVEAWSRT